MLGFIFYGKIAVLMAKRKKQESAKRDENRPNRALNQNSNNWLYDVPEKTKRAVLGIFLAALGLIILILFFIPQGFLGSFLVNVLKTFFGWGKIFLPILLFILSGFVLMQPSSEEGKKAVLAKSQWIGFAVFLLSFFGLVHLFVPAESAANAWGAEVGGGWIGFLLSFPLRKLIGFWGAFVVLLALALSSGLVVFHASLGEVKEFFNKIIKKPESGELEEAADEGDNEEEMDEVEVFVTQDVDDKEKEDREDDMISKKISKTDFIKKPTVQPAMLPRRTGIRRELLFPTDLLSTTANTASGGDIEGYKLRIQKTLENFGIQVEMGDANVGPRVTQYTLKPAEGVKLAQITALSNDLALALAAHPIRIEAPIPGKSLVGIEVPNHAQATVSLREILESESFKKRKSNLIIALGKDVMGNPYLADLEKMPHMLIAGATGSGKSVCLNTLLLSLIAQNTPQECQFLLVDPKRVELVSYNGIPHLITPVITDVQKTIHALRWVVGEMDRRFETFSQNQSRNIQSFNDNHPDQTMPYLVVAIDELADLMSVAAKEVEGLIVRLAQMSRATGIHLVLATQRPSVDVLTGLIKANITSRVAFNVASGTDSRTILDTSGAEKLLGKGDMLYVSADLSKPKRLQGVFVSDEDINKVMLHTRQGGVPQYQAEVVEGPAKSTAEFDLGSDDTLLAEAQETVVRAGKASASLLQRRLRVGYARAARLLDLLEDKGIIGPGDGAKPREVLVSTAQLAHEKQADKILDNDEFLNGQNQDDEENIEEENIINRTN